MLYYTGLIVFCSQKEWPGCSGKCPPTLEDFLGATRIDALVGQCPARWKIRRFPGDDETCRGIEADQVPFWPRQISGKDVGNELGIFPGLSPLEIFEGGGSDTQIGRRNRERGWGGPRTCGFPHFGGPDGGELVHSPGLACTSVYSPGPLAAQSLENLGKDRTEPGIEDPDELVVGSNGIEKRPENIKNASLPLGGELLSHRDDRFEGRVIVRGKKKAGSDFVEATNKVFRTEIDSDPQRFEGIGSAALRSDSAVPVFDHGHPCCGEDKDASGRYVEKVQLIAAGPADIEEGFRNRRRVQVGLNRVRKEFVYECCDLGSGFAFLREGGEKVRFCGLASIFVEKRFGRGSDICAGKLRSGANFFGECFHGGSEHSPFRIANREIVFENLFASLRRPGNVIFLYIVNDSLQGNLILADPSLKEPTFFQSVLLLTEHNEESGALGYILNRPIGKKVGDLLSAESLPVEQYENLSEVPVFLGGPVNTEHLTFSALGWSEQDESLQYSTHLSAAEAVMHQMEGFHIRAFVGYSGWSEGQLEGELERNSWITHKPEREIIDVSQVEDLWKDLLRELSPWYKLIADEPDNLGLN